MEEIFINASQESTNIVTIVIALFIFVVLPITTGFMTYGIAFADFWNPYPNPAKYKEDLGASILLGIIATTPIIGIFALGTIILSTGFCQHGFKWK